jgi:DNA-binding SARP family transcriptional activator/DNA-binding XRE family transcriptional regulator/Tfp pilus assembly protein PilF
MDAVLSTGNHGEHGVNIFGGMLREHREQAGLTQRELAERAGISVAAIRDLEQGRSVRPRLASVNALVTALGLTDQVRLEFRRAAMAQAGPAAGPVTADHAVTARSARSARTTAAFTIGVLGPLVVQHGHRPTRLGVGHHRTVLGRLALTPNTTVRRDDLVDLLWGGDPPPSAVNMVQQIVTRLRRTLEPHRSRRVGSQTLVLLAGGYQLSVNPAQLDLIQYRELVERAQNAAGDPPEALGLLGRALDLWRDEVLADVPELQGDPLIAALTEERITLTIRYARLAEERPWQEQALPRLRDLAVRHPLHEPLHHQLIATLAATGRQADALDTYAVIRDRLADELGIDPGPELVDMQQAVLRQRWTTAVVDERRPNPVPVWRVPPAPAEFTGRTEELRTLQDLLVGESDLPALAIVSGGAGVGKTAFVLRAAERLRPFFPDGQLYVDLGSSEGLHRTLRALGADDLRTFLAGRQLMVVLDGVRDVAQVRPYVLGAPDCAIVVVSRDRLGDLPGATHIELAPFTAAEALAVARDAALQRQLDWYVRRSAAAIDRVHPNEARFLFGADGPGAAPGRDDRALLDAAVQRAPHFAAQLEQFADLRRQAGWWLATAGTGLAAAEAQGDGRAQAELHHLLGQTHWSVGRPEAALAEFDLSLRMGEMGGCDLTSAYAGHCIGLVHLENARYVEAEDAYAGALAHCLNSDSFTHIRAAILNDLGTLCFYRGRLDEAVTCYTDALKLNEEVPHQRSAAANRGNLGMVLRLLGQLDEAQDHLETAIAEVDGEHQPAVLIELSGLYTDRGRHRDALSAARKAVELARDAGAPRLVALTLGALGAAYLGAAQAAEASHVYAEALDLIGWVGNTYHEARIRTGRAEALVATGMAHEAVAEATTALLAARAGQHRTAEVDALLVLARGLRADGSADQAAGLAHEAAQVAEATGSPRLVGRAALTLG